MWFQCRVLSTQRNRRRATMLDRPNALRQNARGATIERHAEERRHAVIGSGVYHGKSFRMNTYISVSKQRTLSVFRMNTYEKSGEGLSHTVTRLSKLSKPLFITSRYSSGTLAVFAAGNRRAPSLS